MRCPSCESDNQEGARFCAACGAELAVTCSACQAELAPGARFCSACGTPVGPVVAQAEPATEDEPEAGPVAERRQISVLFVDLVNFTALAETMDPEEVRAVQARYFEVARSVVATYEGTVEKFIGDAVMAVWGAPTAHEDDAERAVRAALAIVYAVDRIGGAAAGRELRSRAAVATGEAAVTIGAIGQGMVAGDLVNVAARLQSRAPTSGVLVDRTTRDRASRAGAFRRVGSLALKGRAARLEAYRVESATDEPAGGQSSAHTGALVGRDREFRELTDLFAAVMRDGRSRLVSVTGIAGIGKSRIVWELDRWVDALPQDIAWHDGRALPYGEGIAFAAVARMVRRRARIEDRTPPEVARRQLGAALEEIVRDDAERRWIEPRLAALLSGDEAGTLDRDELFAAWRRFFERVAERAPVVMVFEDLHWADTSLMDFIEYMATWSRSLPIFILALARPELLDRRPSWGTGVGSFTAMKLERLPDEAMRELLGDRAPDLPPDLVPEILLHAGGVPLYAVEVVRVIGNGVDRRQRRRTEPASGRIEVPDSLHGLIAARIDSLPQRERRLLLAAAVLGHHFQPEALVAVAGGDPALTRENMESLVKRELLATNEELNSPGRGEVGFVQDLVREVAHRILARSERRSLHLAAARYLEAMDDDVPEQLAGHLVEAHDLTAQPREAERIARRAVAALRRAAAGAMALHVPGRAAELLGTALRLAEDHQRAALLTDAAAAANAAGRPEVAEAHLRSLVELHAAAHDADEEAHARALLASVLLTAQANEPALLELESAMRAVRDWETTPSGVELAAQLARARSLRGNDTEGLVWAERALPAAERLNLAAVATDLLITRGTARVALGEQEAGLADLTTAIDRARDEGWLNTELRARNNEAWALLKDDPGAAMDTARQGFELATAMGLGDIAASLADIACSAAIETGDWDWALSTLDDLGDRQVADAFRIIFVATTAIIEALRGDRRALRRLQEHEPLPPDTDPQVAAVIDLAHAWDAFVHGRLEEARQRAEATAEGAAGADPLYQRAMATRACLWLGDRDASAASAARLREGAGWGRASEATLATMDAGLAALRGEASAVDAYRNARQRWAELRLPLQLALTLLDARRLAPEAADEEQLAATLDELGAAGLARLARDGRGAVSARAAAARRVRSRRPSDGTGPRSGAGRRRQRATDRPGPPG